MAPKDAERQHQQQLKYAAKLYRRAFDIEVANEEFGMAGADLKGLTESLHGQKRMLSLSLF